MFYGEYSHTVDEKGRIIIPSKFRNILENKYIDKFVILKWPDNCIAVFTEQGFEKDVKKPLQKPSWAKAAVRDLNRVLGSNVSFVTCDSQGRINIPQKLLDGASITKKEVAVIGTGNHFEVWDMERWKQRQQEISLEEILEKLADSFEKEE
ncbi:MAG: division/cell wall cluster transcriptional repressor MraZ [Candidatus Aureabacteria bacterium]|nr:division/cell wall cluster transcriptional repressor MraZ [Candidatus Auribacterota bacterium]MCK5161555.1 division/cell wall cluster transcriptional repressor MraZ [Candidatus Auribacterota bacterium]